MGKLIPLKPIYSMHFSPFLQFSYITFTLPLNVLLSVFYIQIQDLWSCLSSLLKRAESTVSQYLPSTTTALDKMFSFLVQDLKKTMNNATCGPYLDPNQDAEDMLSKLNPMCIHLQTLKRKLEELSRTRDNLTGELVSIQCMNYFGT